MKYTIWRVAIACPDYVVTVSRNTKAPTITMAFWLAALILIEVSMRCEMFKPKYRNKGIPARHDWQPVSATAGMVFLVNSGFNS